MKASLREIAILHPLEPKVLAACVRPVLKKLAASEANRSKRYVEKTPLS